METVVDWDGLGAVVPGPELATVLAGLELARVPNDRVLAVVRAQYRQLCHEQARLLAVLDEVARCDAVTTPGAVTRTAEADPFAGDEIRAVLAWTRRAAEVEHDLAQVVIHDLPAVFAAWWAGDIDRPRARVFQRYLVGLTPEQIDRVCQVAVPKAAGLTTGQLAALLRRMVIAVDPDAAARWYAEGVRGRGVAAYLDHDGTVTITATGLPADEAEAACQRVQDLASAAKRAGHPGPISHIRADLFLGLLDGRYHHQTTGQIITTLIATYQPTHTGDAVETGAEATGASDAASGTGAPTEASAPAGTGRSTETSDAATGTSEAAGTNERPMSAAAEAGVSTGLPGDDTLDGAAAVSGDDTASAAALTGAADLTSASTLDSDDDTLTPADGVSSTVALASNGGLASSSALEDESMLTRDASLDGDDILDGDHTHADEASGTVALASTGGLASGAALEDESTPTGDTALDGESTLSGDGALDHDASLDGDGAMTTSNALPGDETPDGADLPHTGSTPTNDTFTGTDAQDDTVAAVQGDPVEDTGPDTGEPARDERVGIEVRVGLATLLGWDERPGEIPGLGPLLAAQARTRVAWQRRAQWRFAVTDTNGHLLSEGVTRHRPHTVTGHPLHPDGPGGGIVELHVPEALLRDLTAPGAVVPEEWAGVIADIATQHHDHGARVRGLDARPGDRLPGAGLRRHTQIRDRTCTFPGCRHAAAACHQDHTIDHAHGGPTTAANLGPACPHDHHLKHQGGWSLTQPEPGVFLWRSKLGGTYPARGQFLHPHLPDPAPTPAPAEPPAGTLTFTLRRTGHPTTPTDRVEPPILHRPPPANPPTPPSEAPRKPTPWHPPDDPPPF